MRTYLASSAGEVAQVEDVTGRVKIETVQNR
jgi:hypothetical protein